MLAERMDAREGGVIVKSGVWLSESSSSLIDVCHLDTISELDSGYHLRQVIETA